MAIPDSDMDLRISASVSSMTLRSIRLALENGLDCLNLGFGWDLRRPIAAFDIDVGMFAFSADGQLSSVSASIPFWGTSACDGALRLAEGGYLADDDASLSINVCRVPEHIHSYDIVWKIRDAEMRNQCFGLIKNAYMRIADKPFRWDTLDHPIDTQGMTSCQLLVARLVRSISGWSLIKETRQL